MQDFNELKKRMMELKPRILNGTATVMESAEFKLITEKIKNWQPAKLADIWPKEAK